MTETTQATLSHFVGPAADLATREILRMGGSVDDLRRALAFVDGQASRDPRAYQALPPHIRRLVDLVEVAGRTSARALCDSFGAPTTPLHNAA